MPVYILSDRPNNRLKIGYTANVAKRLQTHRISSPGLEVVAVLVWGKGDRFVHLNRRPADELFAKNEISAFGIGEDWRIVFDFLKVEIKISNFFPENATCCLENFRCTLFWIS
jgi:hypothetical protein